MVFIKPMWFGYHSVSSDTDSDLEEKGHTAVVCEERRSERHIVWHRVRPFIHFSLTAALAVALAISLVCGHDRYPASYRAYGTFEHGYKTDIHALKPALAVTNKKFYGGVHLDANGTYWLSRNPDEPAFFGDLSPEIDEAWDTQLLRKRYFGLSPEETVEQFGNEFEAEQNWIFDRFWVSPNAYHNLHCLNYVRKSLSPEYYGIKDTKAAPFVMSHRMHLDHCIEQLRQSLMCSLDLTPIPRPWIPAGEIYHADLDRWHTCRDFSNVRGWVDWRNRDFKNEDFDNATARWKTHAVN